MANFLTMDPAHEYMNPYAYVGWNPVKFTDPTGMVFGLGGFFSLSLDAAGQAILDRDFAATLLMRGLGKGFGGGLGGVALTAVKAGVSGSSTVGLLVAFLAIAQGQAPAADIMGIGGGSLPPKGAPGSQNAAFWATGDPLFPGSAVPPADASANVTANAVVQYILGAFSKMFGDVSDAQIHAVPPSSLPTQSGHAIFGQQNGCCNVEIRNDAFSGFPLVSSLYGIGHELTHVLQAGVFGSTQFTIAYNAQEAAHGYFNNPFEINAAFFGAWFASSLLGISIAPDPAYGRSGQ